MFTPDEIKTLKYIANKYNLVETKFIVKGGVHDIAEQVCLKHGLTLENLKSKERTRDHVIARIEFTKRCIKELNKSLSAVGRFLEKDHTTVLYYSKKNYADKTF